MQVTRDQSLVNQLIEAGQLTEEEAETFEHNNIILQALGTADTVQVDLTYVRAPPRRHAAALLGRPLAAWCASTRSARCSARPPSPLEACKTLTERANQAGGHDNITVIVVAVRRRGPASRSTPDTEPLKYRKYALPEEPTDDDRAAPPRPPCDTSPPRSRRARSRSVPAGASSAAAERPSRRSATPARSTVPPPAAPLRGAEGGRAAPRIRDYDEERIDIPGTHVPAWVVVALVVGVVVLLAATAFLFLR